MILYMGTTVLLILLLFLCFKRPTKLIMLISFCTSVIYIFWRLTTIPNSGIGLFLGVLLYIAEVLGFLQFLVFCYTSNLGYQKVMVDTDRTDLPTIDIIIPTYGEPIYILKRTLAAAIAMKYEPGKKQIYICDDGKRSEVRKLCDQYGVYHVVRVDNSDAKSGNVNHVLKIAKGELMVVFDADMMPKTNFLLRLVPYFFDEKVGFVQAPQTFYNPDIFQRLFSMVLPGEQDFFMRDIQPRRANINAAIHVGTNAIFRRSCIDEIGGYPTFSITEDIAVGLMIQANGYHVVYVNDDLVLGLNPSNLKDFLQQRDRWCRGNLQLLKYENPLTKKGLKISQRIIYFDGICYWYTSLLKMLYILAPLLYLTTGLFFINARIEYLLCLFVPYFISQYVVFTSSYLKTRTMFWGHIYETILAPYLSFSCLRHVFGIGDLEFKVTNKGRQDKKRKFYFKEAFPHLILIGLTFVAWGIGFNKLSNHELSISIFLINIIWTVYNLIPMFILIGLAFAKEDDDQREVLIVNQCYIETNTNNQLVKYKVKSLSANKVTVVQNKQHILLSDDVVTFNFNGDQLQGRVEKSTHGNAIIDVTESSPGGFCDSLAIYIDHLHPYFNLEIYEPEINQLMINERGEAEWEIRG